jgi:hypothetical protein
LVAKKEPENDKEPEIEPEKVEKSRVKKPKKLKEEEPEVMEM